MLSAVQAARLQDDSGAHLPPMWQGLDRLKVKLRRGHVHLIGGAPGTFKSVVATNYAAKSGAGCLYLGCDIDGNTWASRAVQMLGMVKEGAEEAVHRGDQWALDLLAQISTVRLAFPSSPDVNEIVLRVFAYAETFGQFPELLVVDNLADVAFEGEEAAGYKNLMDELAKLARQSKAAVLALHHVTGQYEDGDRLIPLSGLQYKVGKKPSLVLTLSRGFSATELVVSVVKNRYGPSDPSGSRVKASLLVRPDVMQVLDESR